MPCVKIIRKVRDSWLINSLDTPYPTLKTYKAELAGDKYVTQYELLIGDVDSREVKKIDINRWYRINISMSFTSREMESVCIFNVITARGIRRIFVKWMWRRGESPCRDS